MSTHAPPSPTISVETLPSGPSVIFKNSSFFSRNGPDAIFPSPAEICARSAAQDPLRQKSRGPPPIRFEALNLIVKFGRQPRVTIAEGQCLWAIRQMLPQVPVPEIYGWTQDGDQVFLFMELIHGLTLEQRWDSLPRDERIGVCEQLRIMLSEMRKVQQAPGDHFLGHVNRDPLGDIVLTNGNLPRAGPFASVKEFHDWLSVMMRTGIEQHWPGIDPSEIPDPYRQGLPDDSAIVLTHSDLHPK